MTDGHELDARGLTCPLPVLKAQKRLRDLDPGEVLRVRTTDPKAPGDFVHFCEAQGHALRAQAETDDGHVTEIVKHGR